MCARARARVLVLHPILVQDLAKVTEQLKASNDSRFKLKAKLEDVVASKSLLEETAQSEQQRLAFALEEMAAEMQVLKAIYQDELDAAKKAAADSTRQATSQLGEQAEEAMAKMGAAQVKLEAAERRLETLGVDAVSLQVMCAAAAAAAVTAADIGCSRVFAALQYA